MEEKEIIIYLLNWHKTSDYEKTTQLTLILPLPLEGAH